MAKVTVSLTDDGHQAWHWQQDPVPPEVYQLLWHKLYYNREHIVLVKIKVKIEEQTGHKPAAPVGGLTLDKFSLEFFLYKLTAPFIPLGKKPKKSAKTVSMWVTEPGWVYHFLEKEPGVYLFVVGLTTMPPGGARVDVKYKASKTPLETYTTGVFSFGP